MRRRVSCDVSATEASSFPSLAIPTPAPLSLGPHLPRKSRKELEYISWETGRSKEKGGEDANSEVQERDTDRVQIVGHVSQ